MIEHFRSRSLLIRGSAEPYGEIVATAPMNSALKYITFRVLRLQADRELEANTEDKEVAIVVVAGTVDVTTSAGSWHDVGKRPDPLYGPAETIYLPARTAYAIRAVISTEIAICEAPAREHHPARLIAPPAESEYTRGEGQARRRINNILMQPDEAGSLFLTEVVTFPGNWSSYPPHKHDEDNPPFESQLEELYYYRARPAAGFAFQRVYTADGELDQTMTVRDCDAVVVPRGYHVCAAAAGYWIYYLNVLAGPKHVYRMTFDPAHAWIKENWTW